MLSLYFPQPSSTLIWLRNCWFCNNDPPKINFSTTIQPKINKVWSWNINVEKWLKFFIFGWFLGWEVDFWLIIVTKSTISQPNINVDIWLRNWSVPIIFLHPYDPSQYFFLFFALSVYQMCFCGWYRHFSMDFPMWKKWTKNGCFHCSTKR